MAESLSSDLAGASLDAEVPEALAEPTRSKNLLFMALYMAANMVIGVGNITLASILLPEHIAILTSTGQTTIYSLILGLGALAAVLTNPVVGMFSDRTTSRLGRRRPWYITGGVLTVVDILLMAHAASLLLLAIGYVVLQIGIVMILVTLSAILPDQVPVRQRATISALASGPGVLLGGLVGQILVAQVFTSIPAAYTSLAITIAVMVALFLLVLREVPLPRQHSQPLQMKQVSSMLQPLGRQDFALVWVARCLIFLGYTTVVSFMFFYLQNVVQYVRLFPGQTTAQGVSLFFAVNVASIILASVVGGILSDKLQRRKVFVIVASVLMALGLLLYAFFPTWSMVLAGTVVMGCGFGVYVAVDLALASQVLPKAADRGKDIGIINAAIYVPMILSPVVAGLTLSLLHSFLALFVLLAVGALIASVLIVPIRSVR
jgi:MFS family permease